MPEHGTQAAAHLQMLRDAAHQARLDGCEVPERVAALLAEAESGDYTQFDIRSGDGRRDPDWTPLAHRRRNTRRGTRKATGKQLAYLKVLYRRRYGRTVNFDRLSVYQACRLIAQLSKR